VGGSAAAHFGPGVKVVVQIEGERFDASVYGAGRRRLLERQAGERVEVVGERQLATGPWARRAQVRHVVGDLDVDRVGAWTEGTELSIASNRLRGALRVSAEATMPADQAALFTGLVIGDDTRQPATMIDDFRSSGLSHLTAVSGQNVAFVLAVVGVVLRSLPRWTRLAATIGVIAWFVVLTRVEPSVLRAGTMAALSAFAFALGRERTATRTLSVATIMLVLIDPLLVWSVGFWLSVGATFGVSAIAPLLEPRLRGPRWLAVPLSITVGAQVGVLLPTWLVFHRMPVVSIVANLLAVPVAGFVMLYGIPAGLLAAATPSVLDGLVMWPAAAGTRWVSTVAGLAARAEPGGLTAIGCWVAQLLVLIAVWRRPVQAMRQRQAPDVRSPASGHTASRHPP
jgi:competence protein ComEC